MKGTVVFSHERSGTHFLMNTIAENFGYKSHPWIDMEPYTLPFQDCFYENMYLWFKGLYTSETSNRVMVKSHYAGGFFDDRALENISKMYNILYIYRDSEAVMRSFHKHVSDLWGKFTKACNPGNFGPLVPSVSEFKLSVPVGSVIRFQYGECGTMINRHKEHVKSWLGRPHVITVKYEELNEDFDNTVRALSMALDMDLMHGLPIRPTKKKVIKDGDFAGVTS